jgi:hypothetical protein
MRSCHGPTTRQRDFWIVCAWQKVGCPRGLTKQTQFSATTIYSDRSPVPAELCVDPVDGLAGSIVVALVGRWFWPAADAETTASLLWFATIQCVESKQDLAGLAP